MRNENFHTLVHNNHAFFGSLQTNHFLLNFNLSIFVAVDSRMFVNSFWVESTAQLSQSNRSAHFELCTVGFRNGGFRNGGFRNGGFRLAENDKSKNK
jgi:hypothetical protein